MNSQWSRSQNGILAGVCKGLAARFDVDVMLVRLAWLFAVLFFGFGLGAYLIFAMGLPRQDKLTAAHENRIFGVCSRLSRRFDLDIGLTRVVFLTLLFGSCGSIFFIYLLLYFILPKNSELNPQPETTT